MHSTAWAAVSNRHTFWFREYFSCCVFGWGGGGGLAPCPVKVVTKNGRLTHQLLFHVSYPLPLLQSFWSATGFDCTCRGQICFCNDIADKKRKYQWMFLTKLRWLWKCISFYIRQVSPLVIPSLFEAADIIVLPCSYSLELLNCLDLTDT